MIGWVLLAVAIAIMFTASRNRAYPREAKTKLIGFSMVAGVIGLLIMYKSYNWVGTFWDATPSGLDALEESVSAGANHLRDTVAGSGAKVPNPDVFYGVMFDAGSTGSRVHAMKFTSSGPGKPYKFLDVKFQHIKPGLSSFAKDPAKGAQSLVPLLEEALKYIPQELHTSTPIALKATAGLRMLPEAESTALLDNVRKLFKKYPFRVFNDSVEIMDGVDEGIFSWFTLNFYLETMQNIDKTLGVMDLGGGSTQVTFVPHQKATLSEASAGSLTDIDIFGAKNKLYTHSYLGLGLQSARLSILGGKEGDAGGTLQSVCFTPGREKKWKHSGKEYLVKGLEESGSRFDKCYKTSTDLIRGKIEHIKEIDDDKFCTISYYYDMAVDYGLIDDGEFVRCEQANWMLGRQAWRYCAAAEKGNEGKNLTVQQFFDAAQTECQKPHADHPFLCLDITYMSALLHDGFGFRKNTNLRVIKRVHGREISWALGAMFKFFNVHHIRTT